MARIAVFVGLVFLSLASVAAPPAISPQTYISGLESPVEMAFPDDATGRMFVLEQAGRVRVVRNGTLLPMPFLDITSRGPVLSGGEQGLLGLAFHPSYRTNGRFYVYYSRPRPGDPGGGENVVQRFVRSATNPDIADPDSATTLLVIQHPSFPNHNGGKLAFGPDGYLHIGVGDGGGGGDPFGAAQSLSDLRGKILRIDVDSEQPYGIPPSNPFAGSANPSVRQEIWAYGLRNPWRFSFDRATSDLLIGDVGQNAWEEVDFEPHGSGGGRNYGWSAFEGTHCFNPSTGCALAGHTPPIIEYAHTAEGGNSVTGGYRYRGRTMPALQGFYVYADFVSGNMWAAAPDNAGAWQTTPVAKVAGFSSFGEDPSGELYAANLFDGTIQRITPSATTIPRSVNLATRVQVLDGESVAIAGIGIAGPTPKTVAIRARGPSLAALGVAHTVPNPTMRLVRSSDQATIATNDDWGSAANAGELAASGFAPSDSHEPGLLVTLPPGLYTAIVSAAPGTQTGIGIVEVFEVDHPEIPLVGLATRGEVGAGEAVMIGGFIIQGNGPQTVLLRARGPSLAAFGVANPLANPALQLVRSSDQAIIAANDDWMDAPNADQIAASGAAPGSPAESALLMTLDPGAYTAIVSGVGGTTGIALVEVYPQ